MVYPFKRSQHRHILVSEKNTINAIPQACIFLCSLYYIQEAFYYGISVPHITVGWKGGYGGVRLILSLFSQFILPVSAHSIHTDPWCLCDGPDMLDFDSKLQEAAQKYIYCCLHTEQGRPTKMAKQAKPWMSNDSGAPPLISHIHTCGCVVL